MNQCKNECKSATHAAWTTSLDFMDDNLQFSVMAKNWFLNWRAGLLQKTTRVTATNPTLIKKNGPVRLKSMSSRYMHSDNSFFQKTEVRSNLVPARLERLIIRYIVNVHNNNVGVKWFFHNETNLFIKNFFCEKQTGKGTKGGQNLIFFYFSCPSECIADFQANSATW